MSKHRAECSWLVCGVLFILLLAGGLTLGFTLSKDGSSSPWTSHPPRIIPAVANALVANFSSDVFHRVHTEVGARLNYWNSIPSSNMQFVACGELCQSTQAYYLLPPSQQAGTIFVPTPQYFMTGADKLSHAPLAIFPTASSYTIVIGVTTPLYDSTYSSQSCVLIGGLGGRSLSMNLHSGKFLIQHSNANIDFPMDASIMGIPSNTSSVVSVVWDQGLSQGSYFLNGVSVGATHTNGVSTLDSSILIGANYTGQVSCIGFYYGVSLYIGALNGTDRQYVENFYQSLFSQPE